MSKPTNNANVANNAKAVEAAKAANATLRANVANVTSRFVPVIPDIQVEVHNPDNSHDAPIAVITGNTDVWDKLGATVVPGNYTVTIFSDIVGVPVIRNITVNEDKTVTKGAFAHWAR